MTTSRNVGLLHSVGDIIAFVDDDANVRNDWLRGLIDAFKDASVGAVAGRTCNGLPGEETEGLDAVGRVLPNGTLTGHFAADVGAVVRVQHGIGANMAFRRDALAVLGGFRDDFPGVGGVREDTDLYLRLGALGYEVVFAPHAVVDHVGAPHVDGRRFDYRYNFWTVHNHALLLARNYGLGSPYFRHWLSTALRRPRSTQGSRLRRTARRGLALIALAAGLLTSIRKANWRPQDPVRRDNVGRQLREHLSYTRAAGP